MNLVSRKLNNVKATLLALVLALVASPAFARTGPDFSGILEGLDSGTIVTAIVAAAAILAIVGFAKWGSKKLGKFFG